MEKLKQKLIPLLAKLRPLTIFIFVAHIILLKWILYTLYQGGVLPFKDLLMHFLGISIYGAALIRLCAFIYHRRVPKGAQRK